MGVFLNYEDLCGHTKSSYIDGQTLVVCNVVEMVWRLRKRLLKSIQKLMYMGTVHGFSQGFVFHVELVTVKPITNCMVVFLSVTAS